MNLERERERQNNQAQYKATVEAAKLRACSGDARGPSAPESAQMVLTSFSGAAINGMGCIAMAVLAHYRDMQCGGSIPCLKLETPCAFPQKAQAEH